jgi:hypothetical protein
LRRNRAASPLRARHGVLVKSQPTDVGLANFQPATVLAKIILATALSLQNTLFAIL